MTCKKASNNLKKKINATGKRVLRNQNGNKCFMSLKDDKKSFQNNPTVRLINPAKNELGKFSKVILDKINKSIRENL